MRSCRVELTQSLNPFIQLSYTKAPSERKIPIPPLWKKLRLRYPEGPGRRLYHQLGISDRSGQKAIYRSLNGTHTHTHNIREHTDDTNNKPTQIQKTKGRREA